MSDDSSTTRQSNREVIPDSVCVTLVPKRIRHLAAVGSIVSFIMVVVENAPAEVLFGLWCVACVLLVYDSYNSGYEEAFGHANTEDNDE